MTRGGAASGRSDSSPTGWGTGTEIFRRPVKSNLISQEKVGVRVDGDVRVNLKIRHDRGR